MSIRPILSLWAYMWRLVAMFVGFAVLLLGAIGPYFFWKAAAASLPLGLAILGARRQKWLWQFARSVSKFHTVREGPITLHYAPELADGWDLSIIRRRCASEFDHVRQHFPNSPGQRAVVYLFATWKDIQNIFGRHYGGTALTAANAIVIGYDNYIQESMRHEFAHLFSTRWNRYAPPLLSEGLSGVLQGTKWGRPFDVAVHSVLCQTFTISELLNGKSFFSEPHRTAACYIAAGSFTGFLIRRFGWEKFQRLYCDCTAQNFKTKFEEHFGVLLEQAETQWRSEVVVTDLLIRGLKKNHT
jgi:hypothetical protein